MSRKRSATSVINGKKRTVVQHAKLPPLKRPDGRHLSKLVQALDAFLKVYEFEEGDIQHSYDWDKTISELIKAAAPFRRYEDHK